MADEYLEGIINQSDICDVFYTYTPQEEESRRKLIELIEAEKRAYLERVEPYVRRLSEIHGRPNFIVRTKPALTSLSK